ncbi:Predicted thiol-disulfide oxidoreductase YuxK, DCC family [Evansella caseinilytica]|uniref:Predicted thiol-disulfide oxidoreductase YuxK, DCC family n=1 Tax=Evansella caseinilytica TaxID=1503961 RepID=A0A1H3PUJ7_9BACI|nr:thiol-disulfide oxidoreductase DCC family protein [Evansella caseinilytica]SDZ04643.1 Predicted thiol-disulfide oxidoreductase YuxK, DCC family [Evansella caseinilytica]
MSGGIILFDGSCNFCSTSVQFIVKRDPGAYYQFAALQSEAGRRLLTAYKVPEDTDSLILIDNNRYYMKSSAALRICKHLNGGWKMFSLFLVIPRPLRDTLYDLIAKNRYKWFGRKKACPLPSPEMKNRFL